MVRRIPTENEGVFLLACTCPDQRQKMVACRHCMSVNDTEGREIVLHEQTHFVYTAAYYSHRLTLPRCEQTYRGKHISCRVGCAIMQLRLFKLLFTVGVLRAPNDNTCGELEFATVDQALYAGVESRP